MPPASGKAPDSGPWLDAWHDPLANLQCFSGCVELADLHGDGEGRFLVAGRDRRLKVFKGKSLVNDISIPDTPCALGTFRSAPDERSLCVAVASGPSVFIYRNLRAFSKFTVPEVVLSQEERAIWKVLSEAQEGVDLTGAAQQLIDLRDSGVRLSSRSLDFLAIDISNNPDATNDLRREMVSSVKRRPLRQDTCVTCMAALQTTSQPFASTCLVLGTENKQFLLMQPSGLQIRAQVELGGVPVMIACSGELAVEWRAVVACRDSRVYTITQGDVRGSAVLKKPILELETQPCALARTDKYVYVGTMDQEMTCFSNKGKKQYSLHMPSPITVMELMSVELSRTAKVLLIGLASGEVRMYRDKSLVHTLQVHAAPSALRFGRYSREDNTLAVVTRTGTLTLKMLKRSANLETAGSAVSGPPPEQDIPLAVPKKTKLYIDQTQRERESAQDMHRVFQNDLCRLRLETARTYVKLLTDGQLGDSPLAGTQLRLGAEVLGLGPLFKLRLSVQNGGNRALFATVASVRHDPNCYRFKNAHVALPCLVPGLVRSCTLDFECLNPLAPTGTISVYLVEEENPAVPLVSAIVNLPQSETLDVE